MNDNDITRAIEHISRVTYLSDTEIRSFANKELIPSFLNSDGIFDDEGNFAKGGLFDPDIFGKSELKPLKERPKMGDNCGFYTFSETMFNPLAVYNILCNLDLNNSVAFDLATCSKGFDENWNIVPIGKPECIYFGADTIKYAIEKYGITIKPEDLAMNILLIIPPRLRPVAKHDSLNTIGMTDVNILYKKVFSRAERYKKLKELNAPEIIILNERRMLYENLLQLMANEWLDKPIMAADIYGNDNAEFGCRAMISLTGRLRGKSEKDREIINTALRISTNTESSVRQVRIGKDLLAQADEILKEHDTNFSEVVRMLMQEIVDTGEVPSIVLPHDDSISAVERLFTAIFGPQDAKHMDSKQLREWANKTGLPSLSTPTLAELFDSGLFSKDPYEGEYTALYPGEIGTMDTTNIDNRINTNALYIEQIRANSNKVAEKLKLNAIRYICAPIPENNITGDV